MRVGSADEIIRLEQITLTYHVGEIDVPVLRGVSLSVRRGEFVALMGASGSGKTTLMNVLGCLDRPTSGRYWLDGQELSQSSADERALIRNREIGFVFQNFNLLPRTSALANVILPLEYTAESLTDAQQQRRGRELLARVGLADRQDHEPSQMSGGQQQRAAIARALVNHPPLLLADEPTGNLDSKTSAELLEMLRRLNAEGITIIIVTHDPEVAAKAQRIIRIRDGVIEGGEAAAGPVLPVPRPRSELKAPLPPPMPGEDRGGEQSAARPRVAAMFPRTVHTAWRALLRNKMRSALTTLGIVIGVAAVIAMMEIGQGSNRAIQQTIASMGAFNLIVQPGTAASGGVTFGAGTVLTLTPHDAEAILKQAPAVAGVAPLVRARTQVVFGNRNWVPLYIHGSTPAYLDVRDWQDIAEGEMFTDRDVRNSGKVCVVGQTIVRELFQGVSPVGREIRVQNVPFRVVGVLGRKGANMMGLDQDDIVVAPWTTVKFRVSGASLVNLNQSQMAATTDPAQKVNTLSQIYPGASSLYDVPSALQMADTPQPVRFVNVDQILAKAASAADVPQAMQQITAILRETHRIRPGRTDDFSITDLTEMTKALSHTADLMGGLLLSVALISLVVGGVGIMNIMLVSVTERTREIGLRMAVGARARQILTQFLIEAIVLCLLGGGVGIALGRGGSALVRLLMNWPTELSIGAIVAAVAVAAGVGIVFGFYPAWKGSRLDPIAALRYE